MSRPSAIIGQFIREGDVDVAVGILGQLGQLCRPSIGHEELALTEQLVEVAGALAGVAVECADDAVVRPQLNHDAAGQDALGAVSEVDRLGRAFIKRQIWALRQNRLGQEFGCAGR